MKQSASFAFEQRRWGLLAVLVVATAISGCAMRRGAAPVEDRAPMATVRPAPGAPVVAPARPAVVITEPAAGTYTVKAGDTLIRIALDSGLNWRDIARWNALENPDRIEIGQVLRLTAPTAAASPTAPVVAAAPADATVVRPLAPLAAASAGTPTAAASASRPVAPPTTVAAASPTAPHGDEEIAWIWPTPGGAVLAQFDELRNKGVDIAGRAGDAVLASADGTVVYAGAGLRGYGNLVILRHNNTYLTAYAHNQSLMVKEQQQVKKGQKIAEMGSSDADRVKLHFEIRRQGKPVDPVKLLPAR